MKPHVLLLVLMLGVGVRVGVQAQQFKQSKQQYLTIVKSHQQGTQGYGYLYQLEDSAILFQHEFLSNPSVDQLMKIPVEDIEYLEFRKKNAILKGVIIGASVGTVIGVISGFAMGDTSRKSCSQGLFGEYCETIEHTTFENVLGYGLILGVAGTGLGSLAGSARIKIPINRDLIHFHNKKTELKKYLVKQQW